MVDISKDVYDALCSIDGLSVYYFYPLDWSVLPVTSYYEITNADYAQADGKEYLSEIAYQVDIWSEDSSENARLALLINEKLYRIGLRRGMSLDLFESGANLHHRTMRFACFAKQDKTIYQN